MADQRPVYMGVTTATVNVHATALHDPLVVTLGGYYVSQRIKCTERD